jgi:hypothetical protein
VSPRELELMKELAVAGRQGPTVPAANRSGLVRMIEKRYVKMRLIGVHEVRTSSPIAGDKRLPMR